MKWSALEEFILSEAWIVFGDRMPRYAVGALLVVLSLQTWDAVAGRPMEELDEFEADSAEVQANASVYATPTLRELHYDHSGFSFSAATVRESTVIEQ